MNLVAKLDLANHASANFLLKDKCRESVTDGKQGGWAAGTMEEAVDQAGR